MSPAAARKPASPTADSAARRVGDQMRTQRRELMASEFEQVAMGLFAERGYDNVSVDDIAAAAGVSARTFYRYFVAKEDVLRLFPRRQGEAVQKLLAEQEAGPSLFDAYATALQRYAQTADLDEVARWWRVVTGTRSLFGAFMTTQLQLRRLAEPLDAQRFPEAAAQPLYFEMVVSACVMAMATASRRWCEQGGDFAALVREALNYLGDGFRKPL